MKNSVGHLWGTRKKVGLRRVSEYLGIVLQGCAYFGTKKNVSDKAESWNTHVSD